MITEELRWETRWEVYRIPFERLVDSLVIELDDDDKPVHSYLFDQSVIDDPTLCEGITEQIKSRHVVEAFVYWGDDPNHLSHVKLNGDWYSIFTESDCEKIRNSYMSMPVSVKEAEENDLAFACLTQDSQTLYEIRTLLRNPDITSVAVGTANGEFWPIYWREGQPSFRSGGYWHRVHRRDAKGRILPLSAGGF